MMVGPFMERWRKQYDDSKYEGPWNADLRALPGFLYDEDDDFDCTYATFYFAPTADIAKLVDQLSAISSSERPAEKWQKLLADMAAGRDSPRVAQALEVARPIIDQIASAIEGRAVITQEDKA